MARKRQERRKHRRILTALFCWSENDQVQAGGTISNISPDGAFIRLPILFEAGETISVHFRLPSLTKEVRATAMVIWRDEVMPRGCGVMFLKAVPELHGRDLKNLPGQ